MTHRRRCLPNPFPRSARRQRLFAPRPEFPQFAAADACSHRPCACARSTFCALACAGRLSSMCEQFAGPAGGDDAVAGEAGGFAVALEEGAVGHDELDLDAGDPAGGAGGAFDEGVGHELAAGAGVTGVAEGVGVPGQGGVHGDALGDGEQGGEVAHGVRGRPEADVPFGGGVAGPLGDGARVAAVGGCPGGGDDAPVPGAVEGSGVGGEFGVDGGPFLGGQAGRFPDQEGGAPFVELPGLQRSESVRHFGDQGFRQAEEPAAAGGGFAPGEGDLRADPGAELAPRASRRRPVRGAAAGRRRRRAGPDGRPGRTLGLPVARFRVEAARRGLSGAGRPARIRARFATVTLAAISGAMPGSCTLSMNQVSLRAKTFMARRRRPIASDAKGDLPGSGVTPGTMPRETAS